MIVLDAVDVFLKGIVVVVTLYVIFIVLGLILTLPQQLIERHSDNSKLKRERAMTDEERAERSRRPLDNPVEFRDPPF